MNNYYKILLLPMETENRDQPYVITISPDFLKQTKANHHEKITLKSGQLTINSLIDIRSSLQQKKHVYCSKAVFDDLFLPYQPTNLLVKVNPNDGIWEFGPYIGIVTDQIKNNHFGTIDSFLMELQLSASEKYFFLYVFNWPNFHNDYVDGYYYNPSNSRWSPFKLPIPHVVHNRIHSRLTEKLPAAIEFFKKLEAKQIPHFNDRFLNKWEVYELLAKNDHLMPYLPDSTLLNGRATIEEMIKKHPTIFLKPIHGSQGKNIFRIKQSDSDFLLDYTTFSGEVEKQYPTIQTLYDVIRPQLQKQRYIVQKGLKLLNWDGRPVDFRFLCHCQNENAWVVTSQVARVSKQNEFVSNIARGGQLFNINEILINHFESKTAQQIKQLLREIALETALAINRDTNGLFGEFGIDLALDEAGKPWIIEVNTKPSKNLDSDGSQKVRPSAKAIIDYCFYLTAWNS